MIAMDLVGHEIGPGPPPGRREALVFVLGAEKGAGLSALVDARARGTDGLIARRLDAEVIQPLSDYDPSGAQRPVPVPHLRPFVARITRPQDLPALLGFAKIDATARFLAGLTLDLAAGAPRAAFTATARDDAATLATSSSSAACSRPSRRRPPSPKVRLRDAAAASKRPLTPGDATSGSLIAGFEAGLA